MKTNWVEIKEEYITTEISYKKLADKYGLSESTLMQRAAKEKWTDQKKNYHRKLEEKIEEGVIEDKADIYKVIANKGLEELKEELDLTINIRKNIKESDNWAEKRVNTCISNVKAIIETVEKIVYPERNQIDNSIQIVMSEELEDYAN